MTFIKKSPVLLVALIALIAVSGYAFTTLNGLGSSNATVDKNVILTGSAGSPSCCPLEETTAVAAKTDSCCPIEASTAVAAKTEDCCASSGAVEAKTASMDATAGSCPYTAEMAAGDCDMAADDCGSCELKDEAVQTAANSVKVVTVE